MGSLNTKDISELRTTLRRVVRDEPVSTDSAETASRALKFLLEEASQHGLTPADVVRSVLSTAFEVKKSCDCPTCIFRRGELDPDDTEPANVG